MSHRYSLVIAVLAALAVIASMVGQMEDINAQNQTISSSAFGGLVLFESPTTVILSLGSYSVNDLGKVIDMAKQGGYKIDSVTAITEQGRPSSEGTALLRPNYTVFMSKG